MKKETLAKSTYILCYMFSFPRYDILRIYTHRLESLIVNSVKFEHSYVSVALTIKMIGIGTKFFFITLTVFENI